MNLEAMVTIMNALDAIVDTGEETLAKGAVGMLIDMTCARFGGDPVEFVDALADAVRLVNKNMGAYEEVAL